MKNNDKIRVSVATAAVIIFIQKSPKVIVMIMAATITVLMITFCLWVAVLYAFERRKECLWTMILASLFLMGWVYFLHILKQRLTLLQLLYSEAAIVVYQVPLVFFAAFLVIGSELIVFLEL